MATKERNKSIFDDLNSLNVNEHTEKKGTAGLTYLSWTWAWAEIKKRYPEANYEVVMHDGLPYVYDKNTGYLVFTKVTIDGITHTMWLPVMNNNNKAMKSEPYEIIYSSGKKETIAAATMFDINKTIMRCLVKNLAMFGLGLYIYAGEDLPEPSDEEYFSKLEKCKTKSELRKETLKLPAEVYDRIINSIKALADGLPE